MGQTIRHSSRWAMETMSPVFWQFQAQNNQWIPHLPQQQQQGDYNHLNTFRVLTYNIWFDDKFQPMRFESLCEILNKSNAQIIGLQEMTKPILKQLLAQPFVQQRYYVSDIDGQTFKGWYGAMMLIDNRLRISKLNLVNFPESNMGRRLVFAEIQLNDNELLRIGTVHLESLNNPAERANQLAICQKVLTTNVGSSWTAARTAILMGDFNFHARGQENLDHFSALPGWIDVWPTLKGEEDFGYTFDSEVNGMLKRGHEPDRSRYDRIIMHSQSFVPTEIKIIGNESVGHQQGVDVFPSDHFGLTAVFEMKK